MRSKSKYSDHYPVIIEFANIPRRQPAKLNNKPQTVWNIKKDGGWQAFKVSTEHVAEFVNIFDDKLKSTTDLTKDIERKMTKKKFEAFGKVKLRNKKENEDLKKLYEVKSSMFENGANVDEVENDITKKLLELQRGEVEKDIREIMVLKQSKGKSAAVFNTLKKIVGNKKKFQ